MAFITGNPSIYDTCKEALKSAIKDKKQAIIGYRNDTNLPMVLEAVRGQPLRPLADSYRYDIL